MTGAIVSISGAVIVAKAFEEVRVEPRVRELVFGVVRAAAAGKKLAGIGGAHGCSHRRQDSLRLVGLVANWRTSRYRCKNRICNRVGRHVLSPFRAGGARRCQGRFALLLAGGA